MLFTEEQLQMSMNPFSILDEAVYLTEQETDILPQMIPIVENNRLQAYVVDFNGIRQLAESADISYLDAAVLVLEQEGIDPSQACIAIDEADLIQFPELSDIGLPIVVVPISEQSFIYQVCEALTEEYLETENEALLEDISRQEMDRLIQVVRKFANRGKISITDPRWFHRHKVAFNAAIRRAGMDSGNGTRLSDDMIENLAKLPGKHLSRRLNNPEKFKRSSESIIRGFQDPDKSNKAVLRLANYLGRKLKKEEESKPDPQVPETPPQEPPKPSTSGSKIGSAISSIMGGNPESKPKQEPPKPSSGGSKIGSAISSLTGSNSSSQGMSLGTKAAIGAGVAAAIGGGILAYKHYRNQPKSVIAKKIAALRSIYYKFLRNAQANPEKAGIFKRVAAKILQVIDKLMAFLQRKADGK